MAISKTAKAPEKTTEKTGPKTTAFFNFENRQIKVHQTYFSDFKRNGYSTSISRNIGDESGSEWINYYIDVSFSKAAEKKFDDVKLDENDNAIISFNGWLTCFRTKNGVQKLCVFVNDIL